MNIEKSFEQKNPNIKTQKEKIDWALIKHILSYSKNKARKSVEAYRKKCQIFTVRNNREINHLLDQLSGYKK